MTFGNAILSGFENYANFRGRSTRRAFWFWQLFLLGAGIGLSMIDISWAGVFALVLPLREFGHTIEESSSMITRAFFLVALLPSFAVGARRLHDTGRSGWWQLLALIPFIGSIVLIVWWCRPSENQNNRFGIAP
ncbi:MAG: DUF805 domain-containing protein [Hyphomicrobiales bacterium]